MTFLFNRKTLWLPVLVIMLCVLSSCDPPLETVPKSDAYVQAKNTYHEKLIEEKLLPVAELLGIPSDCQAFSEQISRYYLPLEEGWSSDTLFEYELCPTILKYVEGDAMNAVGFACIDLNSDGTSELLIGSTNTAAPYVFELWAIVNEKPKLLTQAEENSLYYLRYNKKENQYLFENAIIADGKELANFLFSFNGNHLEYRWDIINGIDDERQNEMAKEMAESGGTRINPPLTPYSALSRK